MVTREKKLDKLTVDQATMEQFTTCLKKVQPDWSKWIVIVLTILSLSVAAAVWASSEHGSIKSWTAEQDYVTKQEVVQSVEKRYVPKENFSRVEQSISDQKEDIKEIKDKVDKIFEMLYKQSKQNKE